MASLADPSPPDSRSRAGSRLEVEYTADPGDKYACHYRNSTALLVTATGGRGFGGDGTYGQSSRASGGRQTRTARDGRCDSTRGRVDCAAREWVGWDWAGACVRSSGQSVDTVARGERRPACEYGGTARAIQMLQTGVCCAARCTGALAVEHKYKQD
ncbi:hypothetical protein B0H10DRAFT_1968653 [Mycena sp. CBHHK59/15]|nr:hypothetical protein B0H10DRAFT_1968653 [Mycena sp. CBHHK59/15]